MTGPPVAVTTAVLGIDASLTRTAFTALTPTGQWHEVITTKPEWPLGRRMRALADAAYRIASGLGPVSHVVIEEPGFAKWGVGPITAMGRAQGAIMAGLPTGVSIESITVGRVRSVMEVKVPRGKGMAKRAVLAHVEALGIVVPRYRSGEHDDDVADGYLLALYAARLQAGAAGPTVPARPRRPQRPGVLDAP